MTNSAFIALRDTISKQVIEVSPETAEQYLSHPVFGLRLEVVNSTKVDVLSEPFILDEEGEKQKLAPSHKADNKKVTD
jgi:hypothetical protein